MQAIEAIIWLKPTEEGGRPYEFTAGWCPHLCVADEVYFHEGQPIYMGVRATKVLKSDASNWIKPGETGEVTFELFHFNSCDEFSIKLYCPLKAGREFEIREGGKTVGTGCVRSRFDA